MRKYVFKKVFFLLSSVLVPSIFVLVNQHQLKTKFNSVEHFIPSDNPIKTNSHLSLDNVTHKASWRAKAKHNHKPKINRGVLCLIKTYLESYNLGIPQTIYKVWAHKCDDYRFIMMIPHKYRTRKWAPGREIWLDKPFKMIQPKTSMERDELFENITSRVFNAIRAIDNRYPNFKWYYLVDDDAYVSVSNMRKFLSDKDSSQLISYGFDSYNVESFEEEGGSGQIIGRKAFQLLSEQLKKNISSCPNIGVDEYDLSDCLKKLGVAKGDSFDHTKALRFFSEDIKNLFYPFEQNNDNAVFNGLRCCSDSFIAMNRLSIQEIIRLDLAIKTNYQLVYLYNKSYIQNNEMLRKKVTFKDVMKTFDSLDEFQKGKNYIRL